MGDKSMRKVSRKEAVFGPHQPEDAQLWSEPASRGQVPARLPCAGSGHTSGSQVVGHLGRLRVHFTAAFQLGHWAACSA